MEQNNNKINKTKILTATLLGSGAVLGIVGATFGIISISSNNTYNNDDPILEMFGDDGVNTTVSYSFNDGTIYEHCGLYPIITNTLSTNSSTDRYVIDSITYKYTPNEPINDNSLVLISDGADVVELTSLGVFSGVVKKNSVSTINGKIEIECSILDNQKPDAASVTKTVACNVTFTAIGSVD